MSSVASGPITITTPGGTATSAETFTFLRMPVILWFCEQRRGRHGDYHPGMDFLGVTAVSIGGIRRLVHGA